MDLIVGIGLVYTVGLAAFFIYGYIKDRCEARRRDRVWTEKLMKCKETMKKGDE